MNPLQRLGGVFESLWSAIDPDEPVFCECQGAFTCPDCSLAVHPEQAPAWPGVAAVPTAAA